MSDSASGRSYSQLVSADQWARCAHQGTALLPDGTIQLTWYDETDPAPRSPAGPRDRRPGLSQGSLVFDASCRAYRSRPDEGRVDLLPAGTGGQRRRAPAAPGATAAPSGGQRLARGPFDYPCGLAVDRRQRLYIAETGAYAVRVIDLGTGRPLRRVAVPGHPVDVAAGCGGALVLLRTGKGGRLVVVTGQHGPRSGPGLVRPCFPNGMAPVRLAGRGPGYPARPAGAVARSGRRRRGGPARRCGAAAARRRHRP